MKLDGSVTALIKVYSYNIKEYISESVVDRNTVQIKGFYYYKTIMFNLRKNKNVKLYNNWDIQENNIPQI